MRYGITMNGDRFGTIAYETRKQAEDYCAMMANCGKGGEKIKPDKSNLAHCAKQSWAVVEVNQQGQAK